MYVCAYLVPMKAQEGVRHHPQLDSYEPQSRCWEQNSDCPPRTAKTALAWNMPSPTDLLLLAAGFSLPRFVGRVWRRAGARSRWRIRQQVYEQRQRHGRAGAALRFEPKSHSAPVDLIASYLPPIAQLWHNDLSLKSLLNSSYGPTLIAPSPLV